MSKKLSQTKLHLLFGPKGLIAIFAASIGPIFWGLSTLALPEAMLVILAFLLVGAFVAFSLATLMVQLRNEWKSGGLNEIAPYVANDSQKTIVATVLNAEQAKISAVASTDVLSIDSTHDMP